MTQRRSFPTTPRRPPKLFATERRDARLLRMPSRRDCPLGTRSSARREPVKITRIELIRLELPLDPPFPAAWDPEPRRKFPATVVIVETDEGVRGIGSGDTMDGFESFTDLFLGEDPLR